MLTIIAKHTGSERPWHLPRFIARIVLNRDVYNYITASYKIKKVPLINNWEPPHPDYSKEIKQIITDLGHQS